MFSILTLLDPLKHCSFWLYVGRFLIWERFYFIKQREGDDIIDFETTSEKPFIGRAVTNSHHLFDIWVRFYTVWLLAREFQVQCISLSGRTPLSLAKIKKKPQRDGRKGTIMIKSNPIPTRWVTHKLESKVPKEFSHCCEGSEPHGRLHSLGQRDWEFPRNLTLKPSEIWLQNFHRTGGNRNSSLGGHNKTLHAPRLKGKEQWPPRRLNQNHLLVLEGLLWRRESAGAHYRDGGLDWEGPPWYTCSWCRVC